MINRFEATGIFISIGIMALALFLLNMENATEQLSQSAADAPASVVLSDENPYQSLYNAVDATGEVNRLVIDDVVIGSGNAAAAGDTVAVHYIGTLQNGTTFDNSYLDGEPFTFTLGEGEVIAGWEEGIVGMKEGGQRILVIPADMAYGDRAVGPIPANATLIFAVELVVLNPTDSE